MFKKIFPLPLYLTNQQRPASFYSVTKHGGSVIQITQLFFGNEMDKRWKQTFGTPFEACSGT